MGRQRERRGATIAGCSGKDRLRIVRPITTLAGNEVSSQAITAVRIMLVIVTFGNAVANSPKWLFATWSTRGVAAGTLGAMAPPPTGDPYAVLGVPPTATDDEVRAAYRARSMLLHPDLHQGRPESVRREAERAMAQLTDAYEEVVRRRAAPRQGAEPLARTLGRMAARSGVARDAARAGGQDGGFVYRLGWLVGRRRSR